MGEYNASKVPTADTNGYTETKEFEVLHQGNVEVNHNKFYCLELLSVHFDGRVSVSKNSISQIQNHVSGQKVEITFKNDQITIR